MERAVRVQRRHRVRGNGVFGHHVHRNLHAVLPVFHLPGGQFFLKLSFVQFAQPHGDFQFKVGVLVEFIVSKVVVAGNDHAGFGLRHGNALRLLIGGDASSKRCEQLRLVTACRLSVGGDDGLYLIR